MAPAEHGLDALRPSNGRCDHETQNTSAKPHTIPAKHDRLLGLRPSRDGDRSIDLISSGRSLETNGSPIAIGFVLCTGRRPGRQRQGAKLDSWKRCEGPEDGDGDGLSFVS